MLALVVLNKHSKNGNNKSIDYIVNRLKDKYSIVTSFVGTKDNTIYSYIRKYGEVYDLICVIGGDGTIHEVVNAIGNSKNRPIIAIIPSGTCNDVAHTLGISKKLDDAIDTILEGHTVELTLYKMNDIYFIYGLALGLLSEVSYLAKKEVKRKFGKLAYYLEALKNINHTKKINAMIDNISNDYSFILCLNSHYLAGFKIRYKDNRYLNAGNIKLILIKKTNKIMELLNLGCFFIFGEYYQHNIIFNTVSNIKIEVDRDVMLNADGELIGKAKSLDISALDNTVSFIVNKKFKNKIIK
jgi:diacylglycerol kinase (ATP)